MTRLTLAVVLILSPAGLLTIHSLQASQQNREGRPTKVSDTERLIVIEEVSRLKARYFRCLDTQDWPCYESVFATDAEARFTDGVKNVGAANIAARIRKGFVGVVSVHHGHMAEIDVESPTSARGIWAMDDIVRRGATQSHGYGHYRETYERINGEWKIKTLVLTRLVRDRESTPVPPPQ